jgi:hypothetical protein
MTLFNTILGKNTEGGIFTQSNYERINGRNFLIDFLESIA